jgi:hypothetical protein
VRGKPRFGFDQKSPLTRLQETIELSKIATLPKCDICGEPYVPVPDPIKPLSFPAKPEELGWEWEIVESKKVKRYHIKCDLETLEDPAVRAKYAELARNILRRMGFNPEEVEWLK